ncbi:MOSC N-terminal beta barrel domain-containing protein, partial [Escherichia coli]|uniref:MOSC N-terminal beta barrel domain-containing protein n=1 Tax=Escherichia coli TaxID=562 RepID=UPI0019D5BA5E
VRQRLSARLNRRAAACSGPNGIGTIWHNRDSTTPRSASVMPAITELFVYPIKSCAGIALTRAQLLETGLAYDRH